VVLTPHIAFNTHEALAEAPARGGADVCAQRKRIKKGTPMEMTSLENDTLAGMHGQGEALLPREA
jgi:phosphoglycerate dehydrogenase-like enzyme